MIVTLTPALSRNPGFRNSFSPRESRREADQLRLLEKAGMKGLKGRDLIYLALTPTLSRRERGIKAAATFMAIPSGTAADTARLFFAIWPEPATREALRHWAKPLKKQLPARWVRPEHYHLTLAFLGPVPLAQIEPLQQLAAALPFAPFELALPRLEFWPRPQVLCLASTETPPALAQLVTAINGVAAQLGLPVERRPFRPHLTLARKVHCAPPATPVPPLAWPVREYCLVESRLSKAGPNYRVLRRFGLQADA
jgi:2'-5' RNA ligase